MPRPVVLCALALATACGGGATAEVAGKNSREIDDLYAQIENLENRVQEAEALAASHSTTLVEVASAAEQASAASEENAGRLEALETRVDGHDEALLQENAVLLGLEARLYDPDYGEFARIDDELGLHETALTAQQADLDATQSVVAANSVAVGQLGATVQGMEAIVAATALQAQTNAADVADLSVAVDGNTADLVALTNTVGIHEVAIVGLQTSRTNMQASIAALGQDVASNAAAIDVNAADIASIQAGYLTAADLAPLESDVAANTSDIASLQGEVAANDADLAQIRTNYLNDLDDLFTYVSTDTVTDEVLVSGADLVVEGRVLSDTVAFRQCAGGRYSCNPKACLALCQANGERMATTDEVLSWASQGNSECAWAWMVDRNNPSVPVRAFPMYENKTTTGCGTTNTGDVPRFGNGVVLGTNWDDTGRYNCACSAD